DLFFDSHPAAHWRELFLLQIHRHHVRAHCAEASIRSVSERRRQTGRKLIKPFQRLNQLLATQVFSDALPSLNQYLRTSLRAELSSQMLLRQLVLLSQRAKLLQTIRRLIRRRGWRGKEYLALESRGRVEN